jgi:hypothetical protein
MEIPERAFITDDDSRNNIHTMIAKCKCQYCNGALEFESENFQESGQDQRQIFGQFVPCPHCNKQTIIYLEKLAPQDNVRAFLKERDESRIRFLKERNESRIRSDSRIEDQLETAGIIILLIGLVAFLASVFLAVTSSQIEWLIVGFAAVFQGSIFFLLFKGFAEVIRLLREK